MRIVVCEDDEAQMMILKEYFYQYQLKNPSDHVAFFTSGEELLKTVSGLSKIHFAFLDIELPGISGLETASILRKANPDIIIVFLTSYSQYIQTAFQISTDQFLLKPIQSKQLFAVINSLRRKYYQSHIQYVENERYFFAIAYTDIIYVEFYKKHCSIHTANNALTIEVNAKQSKHHLLEKGFIRTHQGFYVNPNHIKSISTDKIICSDYSEVPVSHREHSKVIVQYLSRYREATTTHNR